MLISYKSINRHRRALYVMLKQHTNAAAITDTRSFRKVCSLKKRVKRYIFKLHFMYIKVLVYALISAKYCYKLTSTSCLHYGKSVSFILL